MTLDELIRRSREQQSDFDRISITGPGWSGNSRIGFMCNPESGCPNASGSIVPPPTTPHGACCFPDGNCSLTTQTFCESNGGTYQGDGSTCDTANCAGACCTDGVCSILTEADCISGGGVFIGGPCDPDPCGMVGACCIGGTCFNDVAYPTCVSDSGIWFGDGSTCCPTSCLCPITPTVHISLSGFISCGCVHVDVAQGNSQKAVFTVDGTYTAMVASSPCGEEWDFFSTAPVGRFHVYSDEACTTEIVEDSYDLYLKLTFQCTVFGAHMEVAITQSGGSGGYVIFISDHAVPFTSGTVFTSGVPDCDSTFPAGDSGATVTVSY